MLDLLKAAAQVSRQTGETRFPQDILGFTLDYAMPPTLATERARIAALLEGDGFDLLAYGVEDPTLLVLQFPGLRAEQSPDYLFEVAQALRAALAIRSVTPEIEPPYCDIETGGPAPTEGVGDIVWALCSSKAATPADPHWAPKLVRAEAARTEFGVTGRGVRVAQPDTGVAEHRELDGALDLSLAWNFVEGTADPTDPLLSSMGSPGHGTATSSVVASRTARVVAGSAPGASLVPIRTVNSVIIGSGVAVAKAIDHARARGCHVVTMSLGGPLESVALRRSIARAVEAGLIVMAAAGNCVGLVTYPGWDANILCVAAVDWQKRRWKGSCHGRAVDISAPGENLYVARRLAGGAATPADLERIDNRAQGTSYAVALTAGVAALWIERHGIAAIRAEAHRRGIRVQELFRSALRQSAQRPDGWDSSDMGAGIVDARALLALPLSSIAAPAVVESANPALVEFGSRFEGSHVEAEASFVAFDWQLRRQTEAAPTLERALPARPSAALAALLDRVTPPVIAAPAVLLAPTTPPVSLEGALKRLAVGRRGQLESSGAIDRAAAIETIRTEGADSILSSVAEALSARRVRSPGKVDPDLQTRALGRMERALDRLIRPEVPHEISEAETRVVLEALVKLTGRPAIRVRGDGTEVADPLLGDWAADLVPTRARWQAMNAGVGRIDVEVAPGSWVHAGTGFLLREGFVMTNRHVLDTFAEPLPVASGQQAFLMRRRASIIFDDAAADETTRFALTAVVTAGRERIGRAVNLGRLDMAVLRLDPDNGHAPPPPAMTGAFLSVTDATLSRILVTGYPAKPGAGQAPEPGSDSYLAFWDRIGELYGDDYGVKYMSPGLVMERPGAVAGDDRHWSFTHDATTLPGNSGSAVIALQGAMPFCGLHFGGSTLTMNLAHDIASVFGGPADGVFSTAFLGAGG